MNCEKSLKSSLKKESTLENFINADKGQLQQESPYFKFRRHDLMKELDHCSFSFSTLEDKLDNMDIEQRLWKILYKESELNPQLNSKEDFWIKNLPHVEEENLIESVRPNIDESVTFTSSRSKGEIDVEENLYENDFVSQPKRLGRPPIPTGLSKRKDVVLKTMLRRIRAYFWKDFNRKTKYLSKKKYKGLFFLQDCLTFYIENILKEEATSEFLHLLGSFISTYDTKTLITAYVNSGLETETQKSNKIRFADEVYTNYIY